MLVLLLFRIDLKNKGNIRSLKTYIISVTKSTETCFYIIYITKAFPFENTAFYELYNYRC